MKNGTQESDETAKGASIALDQHADAGVPAQEAMRRRPTSVALTPAELEAVKALALSRKQSTSSVMRDAIRRALADSKTVAPGSYGGIVEGIFSETIREDVVELANHLVALAFAVAMLDQHVTRRRRSHARLLIEKSLSRLQTIAGGITC